MLPAKKTLNQFMDRLKNIVVCLSNILSFLIYIICSIVFLADIAPFLVNEYLVQLRNPLLRWQKELFFVLSDKIMSRRW
jgi:hypothetical protein